MDGNLVTWDKYNVWSLVCQITTAALNKATSHSQHLKAAGIWDIEISPVDL